jgi:3-oxoacyl-[acyl-carrier protein] reductase
VIGDSSRVGESGLAIVAAARAGVVALMKSLAREFTFLAGNVCVAP